MKKYIRGARDSLGVPIEPDEETPVEFDYLGDPIYEQEQYFIINDDIVLDDIQNTQKQEQIKDELKQLALKFPVYNKAIF